MRNFVPSCLESAPRDKDLMTIETFPVVNDEQLVKVLSA
jgi:hypothetical protein